MYVFKCLTMKYVNVNQCAMIGKLKNLFSRRLYE